MNRTAKIILGGLIWVIALGTLLPGLNRSLAPNALWSRDLIRFWSDSRHTVKVVFPESHWLQVGEPVYEATLSPSYPIGRIVSINGQRYDFRQPVQANTAEIEIYSHAYPLKPDDRLTIQATPSSLAWVIQTMLPPEMQQRLTKLILQAYTQHQGEISRELSPIVNDILEKSTSVIRDDLRRAIQARSDRFQTIADRYRDTFVDKELIPLVQAELWPLIRERMTPLVEQVGLRLWEEASLFRLTWRYLYDVSPLPQRDLTRKEFQRFLSDQAMPIVVEYTPQFNEIQQQLIREISANPRVQALVSNGAQKLASDSDVQQLVWEIAQETLIQNPRLRAVWQEVWTSPEATEALATASRRLEPTIAAIGETLFGNPNTAITPEFSRVLRNRVLLKDSRWLLVHRSATASGKNVSSGTANSLSEPFVVQRGTADSPNPFHIPARPRN